MKKKLNIRALTETAILTAMTVILSFIKIVPLPLGGAITLCSMLPLCVLSIRRGLKWGLAGGLVYAVIKLMLGIGEVISWGLTPAALIGCIFFDYLFAYTPIGLAGIFRHHGRWGMLAGSAFALFLRFLSHLLSGTLIFDAWTPEGWGSPFLYSVAYNGAYMLPELILTGIAVYIMARKTRILAPKN